MNYKTTLLVLISILTLSLNAFAEVPVVNGLPDYNGLVRKLRKLGISDEKIFNSKSESTNGVPLLLGLYLSDAGKVAVGHYLIKFPQGTYVSRHDETSFETRFYFDAPRGSSISLETDKNTSNYPTVTITNCSSVSFDLEDGFVRASNRDSNDSCKIEYRFRGDDLVANYFEAVVDDEMSGAQIEAYEKSGTRNVGYPRIIGVGNNKY